MFKITKFIIATAFAVLVAGPAYAQSVQYVGPSDDSALGDEGILGFNALCQATYGEGARFCTSGDILGSGSLPATPATEQWVHPTGVEVAVTGTTIALFDITGLNAGIYGADAWKGLSCSG